MTESEAGTESGGDSAPRGRGRSRANRRGARPASRRVKFLAAAISTLLGLLGIELGLRLVGRGPMETEPKVVPQGAPHPDPRLAEAQANRWIPAPSTVERFDPFREHPDGFLELKRNQAGLRRDREVSLELTPGVGRVLVLGDSHAEGLVAQRETFSSLMEEAGPEGEFLTRDGNRVMTWEVLNGAFRRSSPFQQWVAYDRAYRAFEPDQVIVAFYVGNDLADLLRTSDRVHLIRDAAEGWVEREPEVASNATEDRPGLGERIKRPLRRYSAIYRALTEIRWLRKSVVSVTGSPYRNRLEEAAFLEPGWVWQAANQVVYFREHPEDAATALEQLEWIWTRMRDDVRGSGGRLTLVVIPAAMQIHPEAWPERRETVERVLELTGSDWEMLDRQTTAVLELAERLGLECLDMAEALRAAARENPEARFYYGRDQHLNAAGHQVVARTLREFLARRGRGLTTEGSEGTENTKSRENMERAEHGSSGEDGG